VPFGIGQFNNRHPIRGTLFAASEAALFGTAVATFAMFNSLKVPAGPDCQPGAACFANRGDADARRRCRRLTWRRFGSVSAYSHSGIAEANRQLPRRLQRSTNGALLPLLRWCGSLMPALSNQLDTGERRFELVKSVTSIGRDPRTTSRSMASSSKPATPCPARQIRLPLVGRAGAK